MFEILWKRGFSNELLFKASWRQFVLIPSFSFGKLSSFFAPLFVSTLVWKNAICCQLATFSQNRKKHCSTRKEKQRERNNVREKDIESEKKKIGWETHAPKKGGDERLTHIHTHQYAEENSELLGQGDAEKERSKYRKTVLTQINIHRQKMAR